MDILAERLADRRICWLASITGSEASRVELPHPHWPAGHSLHS